ncbi:PAS and helix-turn-helix domain-containing protein [Phaeobacter inhibens]|uniref:PAS and helix-turn-helix domain-containing protein n=1 Tax=Phaeobacter inhibens TaxID=221822 RepID=UPI000404C854|nr:PAS and helix-turn-helix domain-containing protein [Phaeobacter inhibens]UWR46375.1 PAS and helix-turn-helix domain-containing protein [Phaeobacter inhibens]UWR61967.1 PAS and helix-turn-helix domain-containing protein [Phaeobacter inhibens]UWR65830.1 PAS and helix-turn-helix domain-containing protein [Phaeobacter inhibens]UWR69763.1 PAS and helix-turn-helix domain-containing protein [Phaeobacter inhibens]UWR81508.1 PAS and helix-turn-helix domain-containing protein [Phaeobacter inhibens]
MTDLAFEFAPVGIALLDQRVIQRCNQQFAETFGGDSSSYVGLPIAELYPSREDFQRIGDRLQQPDAQSGHYNDERIMRRRNGDLFWCRVRGRSLTPEHHFRSGVWSFADISDDRPVVSLTPRERDVAILTCRGLSAKEIGAELNLSYRTIETHRAHLLVKFSARKLPELVAKLTGMPL